MPRYLVRIESLIEVEANDIDDAKAIAVEAFDFGSANYEAWETDDA
tara:strand:+ start:943 stop:1080 length:138 start_codon:yes stop_codon:yes gene_type:complete